MFPVLVLAFSCILLLHPIALDAQDSTRTSTQTSTQTSTKKPFAMQLDSAFAERTPFTEIQGGLSTWTLDQGPSLAGSMIVGAEFGFETTKRLEGTAIARSQSNGLYVRHAVAGDVGQNDGTMSGWRFGFTDATSYGYTFSEDTKAGVYLSVGSSPLSWYALQPSADQLPRFGDGLRFGEASTAAIGVRIAEPVSITASAEWALVYERHLFWYWAGSSIIEGAADGVAAWFVREIGKHAPAALPVMHFLVRNGIAAGFKALRSSDMNWPFGSAPGLSMITYSVGVRVHF